MHFKYSVIVVFISAKCLLSMNVEPQENIHPVDDYYNDDYYDDESYDVVCYYPNWAQYRTGEAIYLPKNVNSQICTYIIYAFAKIVDNHLDVTEENDLDHYQQINAKKQENSRLKTLLSIGGATVPSAVFIDVAQPQNRREFSENVASYLKEHEFDGIDVDWEYPGPDERDLFTGLIETMHEELSKDGLLISSAFGSSAELIYKSYDLLALDRYIDIANIMTYDLHGGWDNVTGHHAALYGYRPGDQFCQDWIIEQYSVNLTTKKIMLGIPTYGRTYKLCNDNNHGVRDCSEGFGHIGPETSTNGTLSLYEICHLVDGGYEIAFDDLQKMPYAYFDDQWISYENVESIYKKVNYTMSHGLGGVMFWDMSQDDVKGRCGDSGIKYPLIKAAEMLLPPKPTEAGSKASGINTQLILTFEILLILFVYGLQMVGR